MKLLEKALPVIKTIAPMLATALGGPVSGAAVATLMNEFGVSDPKALEDQILNAKPEDLLKLKQAENEFKLKMKELEISEEQLAYADTADARKTYREKPDRMVPILGMGTVAGFFVIVGVAMSGEVKIDSAILGALIGYVSAKADLVLGFYFGSSKGSKEKTDALVAALTVKDKKNG